LEKGRIAVGVFFIGWGENLMRDRLEAALQRDTMPQMLLGVNYSFCHCVDTLLLFYQEKQQKNSGTHDD